MYDYYLPEKNMTVSANTRVHANKIQQAKALFCIRHFAGLVEYSADTNFMEKNKDEIPITAKNMFETAPTELIKAAFAVQTRENLGRSAAETEGRAASKQKTVGQQFKEQLNELIDSVQKTDPHYIRCIKPNDAAKPLLMTRKRTTEQLRYGGVLEAVRVARAGYPVRLPHAAFYQRYRMILPTFPDSVLPWSLEGHEPQQLCVRLVECALDEGKKHQEAVANGPLDPAESGITRSEKIRRMQNQPIDFLFPKSDVQLGKSKVFMRKHPHDCLEAHRVFHQSASATIIQCWTRGLAMQRKFLIIQSAVEIIQRCYRGKKGRERYVSSSFSFRSTTHLFSNFAFIFCFLSQLKLVENSRRSCRKFTYQRLSYATTISQVQQVTKRNNSTTSCDSWTEPATRKCRRQSGTVLPPAQRFQKVQNLQIRRHCLAVSYS
jgi:myosin-5